MPEVSSIRGTEPIPTEGDLTLSVVLYDPRTDAWSLREFSTDIPAAIAEKVFNATVLNNIPDEVKYFEEQEDEE